MSSGELETKKSGDFYWSKDDVRHVVRPASRRARPRRVVRPTASLPAAVGGHVAVSTSRPPESVAPSR